MKKVIAILGLLTISSTSFAVCSTSALDSDIQKINSLSELNSQTKIKEIKGANLVFVAEILACAAAHEPITQEAAEIAIVNLQAEETSQISSLNEELAQLNSERSDINGTLAKMVQDEINRTQINHARMINQIRRLSQ